MVYAVSYNDKLYIISLGKVENIAEEIRKILEKTLDKKDISFNFIEVHGKEYESNDLSNDNPEKQVTFYDNSSPKKIYRNFNKNIINLD